jgi:hypothetical protein
LIDECLTGVGIAIEKESHFLKVSFEHTPKQEGQARLGWKTVKPIQELTPYGIGPTLCRSPRAHLFSSRRCTIHTNMSDATPFL